MLEFPKWLMGTKTCQNLTFILYIAGTETSQNLTFIFTRKENYLSKALITDKEYRRFEDIIYRLWYVYEFGQGKSVRLTAKESQRLKQTLSQLKQDHPREYDIIVRHFVERVYYTTIAREQEVSEGYIRKLAKNGAYYFLKYYDDK